MKILHLIIDHQVIERTLDVYEKVFPGCNEVVIFGSTRIFKHLHKCKYSKLVLSNNGGLVGQSFNFGGITHIIAHYMTMDMIDFIKNVPSDIHVCWEVYGYDLYNQFLEPNGLKLYYTDPVRYDKYHIPRKYFPLLFNLLLRIKGCKYLTHSQKKQQFNYISQRVNSVQYCCYYDAKYIEDYTHRKIHSYEIFNYSLSEVLGDLQDVSFYEGRDIMVGNSASYSNNHLYVLKYLSRILGHKVKLIIPLSYGGCKKYADEVEDAYESTFPQGIEALRNYLPLHVYNKTFLRLKAMILSAWRQESQGTAIMGFYLGIKVFMSEKSPLYKWFLDCGFKVFALEAARQEDFDRPLTLEEKQRNREIVLERYNEERIAQTFKENIVE